MNKLYIVKIFDTEFEVPYITACETRRELGSLLSNLDRRYEIKGDIIEVAGEFIPNWYTFCKNNDIETGKGENINVDK